MPQTDMKYCKIFAILTKFDVWDRLFVEQSEWQTDMQIVLKYRSKYVLLYKYNVGDRLFM